MSPEWSGGGQGVAGSQAGGSREKEEPKEAVSVFYLLL